jgi:hypothetical protein
MPDAAHIFNPKKTQKKLFYKVNFTLKKIIFWNKWNNLHSQIPIIFFFIKSFFFRLLRFLKMSVLLFSVYEQEILMGTLFLLNSFWDA